MKRSNKKAVEIDIRLKYLVGLIKYLFLVKYEVREKYRIGKPVFQTISASTKLKDVVDSESLSSLFSDGTQASTGMLDKERPLS